MNPMMDDMAMYMGNGFGKRELSRCLGPAGR
jgi:hypothetical protein